MLRLVVFAAITSGMWNFAPEALSYRHENAPADGYFADLFAAALPAAELPELGDVSQATISPRQERELGLKIMSEIRADRSYMDDAEIAGYLSNLGSKLILGSSEAHPDQEFEFFALQDPTINAFALPGGFMGFNSGLILAAQSESELAGVMAHEIAHVTQKHLARMIAGQKYSMLTSLAALALAVLAARTNPQAAQAVLVGSQAAPDSIAAGFHPRP